MFQARRPAFLPWRTVAPSPPRDVMPDQVREAVASRPEASALELSTAFLHRRPGSDVEAWRRLDRELEESGIDVYFVRGGTASWELHISVEEPAPVSTDSGPTQVDSAGDDPQATVEPVTPAEPGYPLGPGVTGLWAW